MLIGMIVMVLLGYTGMCSSATILLAGSELVGLCRVLVPQILVPEHPAIIDGVAVGAVVVPISWIHPIAIVTIVGLYEREISMKLSSHYPINYGWRTRGQGSDVQDMNMGLFP